MRITGRSHFLLLSVALVACGASTPAPVEHEPALVVATVPAMSASAPTPVATSESPPAITTPVAAPAPPVPSTPAADPAPAPTREIAGTLKSRKGKEVVLHLDGTDLPDAGAKASLSKYFESKPGEASPLGALSGILGGSISGWIVIADVTVKSVNGGDVTVRVDAEKSDVVVNGKKVNQFTPGAKVTLTL